jgi:hypothetical protein
MELLETLRIATKAAVPDAMAEVRKECLQAVRI